MDSMDTDNMAIDLSLKPQQHSDAASLTSRRQEQHVPLVRPTPRLPWTITWYQSMWSHNQARGLFCPQMLYNPDTRLLLQNLMDKPHHSSDFQECSTKSSSENKLKLIEKFGGSQSSSFTTVLDVACCDGPVVFERVSNPNFALTVEHTEASPQQQLQQQHPESNNLISSNNNNNSSSSSNDVNNHVIQPRQQVTLKTYLCIYCNQSFKSLFCYQKHKKRHLNPVSVDITATHDSPPCRNHLDTNKAKTKDLNVQFFPCKKCGSKFPSYYFVHKHRKVCHSLEML